MPNLPDYSPQASSPPQHQSSASQKTPAWRTIAGQPRFWLITTLVALGVISRWLPHPPNFTPIGALALFGGTFYANWRWAFSLPLLSLFLSDLVLGLHILMPVVYGSFALNVLLGRWLRFHWGIVNLAVVTLVGSFQFYLTTNFACWILSYPHTLAGLIECYVNAIPFFRNSALADATYTVILFGSVAVAERVFPVLREPTRQPTTA
ncbi:MAG: hypothetical protein NZU63_14495 [Gemmataceae bacterium]|nr:hypothetical protein [Gemmataceae bacterium]MDW8244580.1 DUF6580 family putative transport protein [Thermogemmata sp.]